MPIVPTCHPERKLVARGLCHPCYKSALASGDKVRGVAIITCGHPDRRHKAKGMCEYCYKKPLQSAKKKRAMQRLKQSDPERYREKQRIKKLKQKFRSYGTTMEEVERIKHEQNGLCAICKTREATAVDHCHDKGKFRAILCAQCNAGLGHFQDNPEWLTAAAAYVRMYAYML